MPSCREKTGSSVSWPHPKSKPGASDNVTPGGSELGFPPVCFLKTDKAANCPTAMRFPAPSDFAIQTSSLRARVRRLARFLAGPLAVAALLLPGSICGAATSAIQWQRWEQAFSSSVAYSNHYRDVTVVVTYTSPEGSTLQTLGFWDGGSTFKIRCAFPSPGLWSWQTTCSDSANAGLHQQSGSVTVTPYSGDVALYRHGALKVSANRRYLTFHDGTPFLWMGDTAWVAPLGASQSDWQTYIADRKAKHFTVIQIAPASRWSGLTTDTEGNEPFFGADLAQWNPAYWLGFEQKVQHANEQGLYVLVVGIMEPESR